MEGDAPRQDNRNLIGTFQSTPSAWRETKNDVMYSVAFENFNPLPPHGGRPAYPEWWTGDRDFNPLPPHGGRHQNQDAYSLETLISIHSLRMEGDLENHSPQATGRKISIHSLRMEGDFLVCTIFHRHSISIHSLRMEGDRPYVSSVQLQHISIHSLRMEGDHPGSHAIYGTCISIHSLRMEGDKAAMSAPFVANIFQSTPSAWRETRIWLEGNATLKISIHSLRMEGDRWQDC